MDKGLQINEDKTAIITVEGQHYQRWAIRTPLVTQSDDLTQIVMDYAAPYLQKGDILFLSEKMVACSEGRAIPMQSIRSSKLGTYLSKFAHKSPYGIGLATPQTMTMAISECGAMRILVAAAFGAIGRALGRKGWFYRVAGRKAAAIDGPCAKTIPPYNQYVVLGPKDAGQTAQELAELLEGVTVLIVDINDLGGGILGSSDFYTKNKHYLALLADNPLGQTNEQTPMGIIRCENSADISYNDCWHYLLDWHA